QIVLNQLLVQTQLQTTFSINMLALVENQSQPKILSLRHILDEYLTFQEDLIVRRTDYDLKKALERAHLLEGLITAQNNIDEVVRIIRESYDDAKQNLCARFGLDDVQAQAILDMRLKQIQRLDREKLQAEYDELQQRIRYYNELLADPEKIKAVLKEELIAIRDKYGDERMTEIQDVENEIDVEDLIPVEDCVVTLTKYGYVKRQPADTYRTQRRGGRGVSGMTRREEDFVTDMFTCSTHDFLLFFTTRGRVYRMKSYEIPESSRTGKGTNIINLLPLEADEKVTSAIKVSEFDEEKFFCMVTRQGTIKRTSFAAFKNIRKSGLIAIGLDDGDELAWVKMTDGNDELIVATYEGRAIRFNENDAREMGRNARGVRAIALDSGDHVIGMAVVRENCYLLTVSERGSGRRTEMSEYPIRQRGGKVVLNLYSEKNGPVAGILTVEEDDNVFLIADDGVIIRIDVSDIAIQSRYGGGVRVMRLAEDSRLVSIALASVEDKDAEEEAEGETEALPESEE
ncbi:MAG: DNA gyrase subunit A, partial [Oscillospiraceae bacterium]|nr:DNA gyrase subunit A [Oscillospiraceae bacterium]